MGAQREVIVIGGGLAGIVTAARLVELGHRPVVLEQGSGARYPCNSRASGGIFHVSYTDMKAAPTDILKAIMSATRGNASPELAEMMANNAARAIDWLTAHGTRFIRSSPVSWHRWTVAPPRPMQPGISFPGYGIDTVLQSLARFVAEGGGQIRLGHRATSAPRGSDGLFEVTALDPDGREVKFRSARLVIADGGFQANPAILLKEGVTSDPGALLQRGAGTGSGFGATMAQALGADIVHARQFYGHILHRNALQNPHLWPYPQLDSVAAAAVVLDAAGTRFCDEGRGGIAIANAIAALADPASATVVFDEHIWEREGKQSLSPVNPDLERLGGSVIRASHVADLAAQLGIEPKVLAATLDTYNAAVSGDRSGLTVPRTGTAVPLDTTKLMAVPLCAGITHTMGGLRIDARTQVLDASGKPVEGLYAAGTCTGGLEGGESVGYVGGLSQACIMGLVAAEEIAGRLGKAREPDAGAHIPPPSKRRYPALRLAAKHGSILSLALAAVVGVITWAAFVDGPLGRLATGALTVIAVAIAYSAARVLTELIALITHVLLPMESDGD